jgi:hypothetical protein
VTAVSALATVALIFTYALVSRETSVSATAAGSLPIASLLALPASLAARLRREVRLFVLSGCTRNSPRRCNGWLSRWGKRRWRDRAMRNAPQFLCLDRHPRSVGLVGLDGFVCLDEGRRQFWLSRRLHLFAVTVLRLVVSIISTRLTAFSGSHEVALSRRIYLSAGPGNVQSLPSRRWLVIFAIALDIAGSAGG